MNYSILKTLDIAKIVGGLSKTLNAVKQAIPIYQQFKPILSNVKDLSKIVNIINSPEQKKEDTTIKEAKIEEIKKVSNNNLPTFFQ